MKKIIWCIIICVICICIVYLVHLYKRAKIISNFKNVYISEKEFDTFCENNNTYELEVDIENSRLSLSLERDNNNIWNGSLFHYNKRSLIMYEKIPISIEDQELIIHTEEPKKISLSKILLYKNFDFDQYYIKQVHKTSMDFPTERIRGDYPVNIIKPYMKTLYDELFSNLNSFDRKEDYFSAVEKLESVMCENALKQQYVEGLPVGHSLFFSFNGNSSIK